MEPLVLPQRDEEAEFSSQLMALLNSPVARHCNGLSTLFSPDLNAGSGYELASNGSLGSPDFTRQLNSAGLPGFFSINQQQQPQQPQEQQTLPSLQLPPLWPGGWQADSWLPQSPTCPVLSPLGALHNGRLFAPDAINSNGFHLDQGLLAGDAPELQPTHSMRLADPAAAPTAATAAGAAGAAAAALAQVYPPVTPQQLQLPKLAVKQEEHLKPLQQQQQHHHQQQQQQQHRQVHLPPGVWLVAPTAHELVAPVVVQQQQQQSPGAGCGTAANNAVMHQQHAPSAAAQQQGRKRQLRMSSDAGRKAARTSSSGSPSATGSAAAGTADAAHPQQLSTIPEEGGSASLASLGAPRTPAAVAGRAGPARGAVQLGVGTLVWGKVSRFPWWPAVVVAPAAADQPAPTGTDAGQGSSSRPSLFVRFLGTHDTAWLDPRQVSPWPVQLGERSSKTKAAAFVNALKEGRAYAATGALPDAFIDELPAAVQKQQQQEQEQGASHAPATSAGSSRGTTAGSSRSRSVSQEPLHGGSSSSALAHMPAPVALVAGAFAGAGAQAGMGTGGASVSGGQPAMVQQPTGTQQHKAAAARVERVATRSVQDGAGDVRQTRSGRQRRG